VAPHTGETRDDEAASRTSGPRAWLG